MFNDKFIRVNNGRDSVWLDATDIRDNYDTVTDNYQMSMNCENELLEINGFLNSIHKTASITTR